MTIFNKHRFLTTDVYKNYSFKKYNQFLYFKNNSNKLIS